MIVKCNKCSAEFRLNEDRIKPQGSKVRCSKCGHVFKLFKPEGASVSQPPPRPAAEQRPRSKSSPEHTEEKRRTVPDPNVEVISGESSFPQADQKEITAVYSEGEKRTVVEKSGLGIGGDQDIRASEGIPIDDDLRSLEGAEPLAEQSEGQWEGVTDKELVRQAKPPVVRSTLPARIEKPEGDKEESGGGEFDWENLDVDGEISEVEDTGSARQYLHEDQDESPAFTGEGERGHTETRSDDDTPASPEETVYSDDDDEEEPIILDVPETGVSQQRGSGDEVFERDSRNTGRGQPPAVQYDSSYSEQTYVERRSNFPKKRIPPTLHMKRADSSGLKTIVGLFFALLIVGGTLSAGVIIASNMGIIDKSKADGLIRILSGFLPSGEGNDQKLSMLVTEESSKWLSTRNGYIFVVSGHITNKSDYIINYLEIESEFMSGEEMLYAQVAYAGNTFTADEIKSFTLEEIDKRLNRKNGDIDFRNTEKLAGLNFGILPDEIVPYFAVFPSESRILGLRYRVKVIGFEKGPLVND
ncbi:MAG: zinc-ribbon domain-containing protein [Candidatus Dadabacteria bacterium]|nr:zinc-ribbon domain-containing protein [Candidatus Dadabacteria bacterium]